MFITFEGGEGVGKSTQISLLQSHLQSIGKNTVITREPGGTKLAEIIRKMVVDGELAYDGLLEYSLIAAARRDHINTVIKPALASNRYVLCDRFYDSSVVYQGIGKGLDLDLMWHIHQLFSDGLLPDLTILFDLDVNTANKRISKRKGEMNHYDKQSLDFHNRIREGFLAQAQNNLTRIKIISANQSVEEISQQVIKLLEHH